MDCIFCKIINDEIPAQKLYEDEKVLAFYDINPQAPVHFLIIPKQHISCASEINETNSHIIAHIFEVIATLVANLKLSDGYRIVNNCGVSAGQTVGHLHFHVLGGADMGEELCKQTNRS